MAIKSKGRARGRRTVAAAPRRPLVVRKPPIWRRPWIWIVLGVLAVGGIAFGVHAVVHNHGVASRKDREKLAMTKVYAQFKSALPADHKAVPPDLLVIFPSVTDDLPKIGKDIKGEAARKRGTEIADQAKESFTKLQAIQVNSLVPAEFAGDRTVASDALLLVSRGISLYQQVGGLVTTAADLPRPDQKAVIDQATALTQQAAALFDAGYRKLLPILTRLVIPHTVPASVPSTPGFASPSETPSATPTGSASPSP